MLSMCVLALTDPLQRIDLVLSSTLFSIFILPTHPTNKDTSIHSIIQILLPAGKYDNKGALLANGDRGAGSAADADKDDSDGEQSNKSNNNSNKNSNNDNNTSSSNFNYDGQYDRFASEYVLHL